ncbi:MAG TPA: efflux RND transporter periplasmic adaptor subunit [Verrucomicrobiae bacterium]|nr:efflux RND transporter periplasmic adaptor subunit [Verrucomicrobiae bacterium]
MRNFIVHALIIGSLAPLLSACAPNKPPASPPPSKVTVSHPRTEVVTNWDEYPGHIEAVETVELRPRVSGYLESIHFEDGTEVKAGDLLFVIDPKPYQADLDRASAERQQAETRLELARSDLRRAESLRGTKAISEEEYDSRNKAVRESEAALAASRAAESTAQLNLDYTRITAPVSGKIGRRLVTVGNLVQLQGNSGATVLATIVSMDPIYCYFDVDEGAFLKYRAKMKQATNSDEQGGGALCDLQLADEETFTHRGRLDFFDNQVNPQTGTIRLRAVFPNADRTLVPGMFATLRVLAGAPEPAMLIPDVAVLSDQGYKYVYIVGNEGTVQARPISTGRNYGSLRAVTKGLAPDDQVVINGLLMLRPGAKVDVEGKGQEPAVRAGASGGSQEGHQPATGEPNRKS